MEYILLKKLVNFLCKKLAFDQPELQLILEKILDDDFHFSLTYGIEEPSFLAHWTANIPNSQDLSYINSFKNVIVSEEDVPIIHQNINENFLYLKM